MEERLDVEAGAADGKLPDVRDVSGDDLTGKMDEAAELKRTIEKSTERLKDIELELAELCEQSSLPGVQSKELAFYYRGLKTKWTLNKNKLLENGVDVDVIQASYVESKPYLDCRFVKVKTTT